MRLSGEAISDCRGTSWSKSGCVHDLNDEKLTAAMASPASSAAVAHWFRNVRMANQVCTRNDIKTPLCRRDSGEFPLSPPFCRSLSYASSHHVYTALVLTRCIQNILARWRGLWWLLVRTVPVSVPSVLRATARRTLIVAKKIWGVQPLWVIREWLYERLMNTGVFW